MKVKMKKATLAVMRCDAEKAVHALQSCGEFMVIPDENGNTVRFKEMDTPLAEEAASALDAYSPYRAKKGLLYTKPEYTREEFEKENIQDKSTVFKAIEIQEDLDSVNSRIKRLTEARNAVLPFLSLDIDGQEAQGTKYTSFICGKYKRSVSKDAKPPFIAFCEEKGITPVMFGAPDDGYVYFSVFKDDLEDVTQKLSELDFETVALPYKTGTAKEENERLTEEINNLTFEKTKLEEKLAREAENAPTVELFYDRENAKQARMEVSAKQTEATVIISGWVREDKTEKVEKAISSATEAYSLSFSDPEKGEDAPCVTKSNKFAEQYACITDAFSLPSDSDIDPNPIMAPWYFIIFGMMMGDIGYGILTGLLLYLFKRLKKPRGNMLKLVNVMLYSSITAIIFGFVFGSFFGNTLRLYPLDPATLYIGVDTPPGPYKDLCLINPQGNITGTLILTMILGALHIFTGMIIKAVMLIKEGKWIDAVCDQFSWIILISGVGMIFLGGTFATVGIILACSMALLILLTGGRAKKGVFGKLTGGLGALYGATSFLSDILSYSRILALCLSTSIIGWVMNMLAGMVCGAMPNIVLGILVSIVIYALGHGINFALGLLSAYVHTCRLQYIEFFGKFYDGGGTEFKPLKVNSEYVEIKDENK